MKIDEKTFKVAIIDGKANANIPEGTVYTTPSRFGIINAEGWYQGGTNSSICFSVDSEDIFMAGFCVFGGPRSRFVLILSKLKFGN